MLRIVTAAILTLVALGAVPPSKIIIGTPECNIRAGSVRAHCGLCSAECAGVVRKHLRRPPQGVGGEYRLRAKYLERTGEIRVDCRRQFRDDKRSHSYLEYLDQI